ncbi:MAG: recombinase family protein, partial [Terriglobia bacterium]
MFHIGNLHTTDGVSARSLKDEILALEVRQEEMKTLLADAKAPEPLLHPNLAEVYRRKVANLNETLQQEETKAEAAEIIRSLVDEIVLVPENGELRIDLKGELAGILSLASANKKPATHVYDGLEQIKVVAGA